MSGSSTSNNPAGPRVGICVILSATLSGAYKPQFLCWKPIDIGEKVAETIPSVLTKYWKKYETNPLSIFNPSLSQIEHFCKTLRASADKNLVIFHLYGMGLPEVAKESIWIYLTASSKYHPISISSLKSWLGSPTCIILDCNGSHKVSTVSDFSTLDKKFIIIGRTSIIPDTKIYPRDFLSMTLLTPLRSSVWSLIEHQLNDPQYQYSHSPHKQALSEAIFSPQYQTQTQTQNTTKTTTDFSGGSVSTHSTNKNPTDINADSQLSGNALFSTRYLVNPTPPAPLKIKFRTKFQSFDKNETIQSLVGYNIEDPPKSLHSPKKTFFRLITKLHYTNTAVSISRVLRALADSISWDIVNKQQFLEFFRAEQTLSTLLRHFLIYISITPSSKFSKFQSHHVGNTRSHPLWYQWRILLATIFRLLYTKAPCSDLIQHELLTFFQSHLQYFESYKSWPLKAPPKSLPLLLHAFLTPNIRETSLISIVRFLQRGFWAVRELLDIGLIPYLTHSLKHDSLLSRQLTLLAIGLIIHQQPDHTFLFCEQSTFFSLLAAVNSPASCFRLPALYIISHILSYCLLPNNVETSQSIPSWFSKYHLFDICTQIVSLDQNILVTQWSILTLALLATTVPSVLTGNYAAKFGQIFGNLLWSSSYPPIRESCVYALASLLVLNENLRRTLPESSHNIPHNSSHGSLTSPSPSPGSGGALARSNRMRGLELSNFSLVVYSCTSSYDGSFIVRATWIHFLFKFLGFYTRDLAQAAIQVYYDPILGEVDATTLEGVILQIWTYLRVLLSDPCHLVVLATLQLLIRINTLNFSMLTESQITELHSLPPLGRGPAALETILREFQKYHLIPLFAPSKGNTTEDSFSLHWVHEVAGISAEISASISHYRLVSDSFLQFPECAETGINCLETEKYFSYLTSITLPSFSVSLLNTPALNLFTKSSISESGSTHPSVDFPTMNPQEATINSVNEELASKTISFSAPFDTVQKRLQTLDHPCASIFSYIYSSKKTFRTFWRSIEDTSSLTAQGILKFSDDIANHLIFHPHAPFLYCISSTKIYSIDLSSNSFTTAILDPFYRPPVLFFDSWASSSPTHPNITHAHLLDTFSDKLIIANDRGQIQIWRDISSLHSSQSDNDYLEEYEETNRSTKAKSKKARKKRKTSNPSVRSGSNSTSSLKSTFISGIERGNPNPSASSSLTGVYSSFSKFSKSNYFDTDPNSFTEPTLISAFTALPIPSNKKKLSLKFASSRKNGLLFCSGDVSILATWDIARESRISTIRTVPGNAAASAVSYITTSTGSDISDCVLWLGFGDGTIRCLDIRMPTYYNFTHCLDNQANTSYITGIRVTTSQTSSDSKAPTFRNWKCNAYCSNGSYLDWDMRSPYTPISVTQLGTGTSGSSPSVSGSEQIPPTSLDLSSSLEPVPLFDTRDVHSTLGIKRMQLGSPGNLLSFHPNLNLMALSTSESIRLLDLFGETKYDIPFHDDFLGNRMGQITGLGFHPYDRILAAASGDGLISLYSPNKLYSSSS